MESAGEPLLDTGSSELFGTHEAHMAVAFSRLRLSLSCIDTAAITPDFVRRWHRRTQSSSNYAKSGSHE